MQLITAHRQDATSAPFRSGSDESITEAIQLLDSLMELETECEIVVDCDDDAEARKKMAAAVVDLASNTTISKAIKRASMLSHEIAD